LTGESVRGGELLAVISDTRIEDNISQKLEERKVAYETSKREYARSLPLMEKQLISRKEMAEAETRFRQDSLRYFQLFHHTPEKGIELISPIYGYIFDIHVANGEYITQGSSVFTLRNDNRVLIKAYLNQADLHRIPRISDAHFKLSGYDDVFTLNDIEGKLITENIFSKDRSSRVPIVFSAKNSGNLTAGRYLEVYLKTQSEKPAIVLPVSAFIEELDLYYVFVQTGGETFVKKEVKLAGNDGRLAAVEKGLEPGQRVVVRGAYQIKLAAMAGDLPLHGHTH
jgi:RND family efflux transporter MFP subunit